MSDEGRVIPREFERELIQTETLVVELREAGGRALSGLSRNLSLSGIFVETRETIAVDTEIQLFIGSTMSSSALRAMAKVVHVAPGVGFGAQFLDSTEEARECVMAFIKRFRRA